MDFQNKSAATPSTQPEIGAIAETLDVLTRKVNAMLAEVTTLVGQRNDLLNENAQKEVAIASLLEENSRLLASQRQSEIKHQKRQQKMLEAMGSPSPEWKRQRLSNRSEDDNPDMGFLLKKKLFPDNILDMSQGAWNLNLKMIV